MLDEKFTPTRTKEMVQAHPFGGRRGGQKTAFGELLGLQGKK